MRVWRICREAFAQDPLSGRGGLFTSGRWHRSGKHVVYTSASLALAALEFLAHVDPEELPPDLVQIEIDTPDEIEMDRIEVGDLPPDWRDYPAPETLQQLGDEWLEQERTLVLQVPSAIIPEERNYLLNPTHPEAKRLAVVGTKDFVYDPRLTP